jgi:signal transduction histidine kinase
MTGESYGQGAAPLESFIQEMKRYLSLHEEDRALLRKLGPRMEKYLPEMAERFYAQIPHHPNAFRVFTGGDAQIARLKQTLQAWGRGLFGGVYDEAYAEERYQIGYRHVRIGLEQKYVISAMGVVRAFLSECLMAEYPTGDERLLYARALGKILDLDLNLMCESYFHATMEHLHLVNKQLEQAMLELADASRVKDEFLAQVSHELRTPLNSILGFTKLILDGICHDTNEERELLRDVYMSGQHLLSIVNDLLDIARFDAGKMELHLENINPRHVLDSTLPLVAVQAAAKNLQLRDETLEINLPMVLADEVRFRQVLLNLLSNAIKFTPQGSITVRGRVGSAQGFLRLEVEDTGVGVPLPEREAVFEKFVQARGGNTLRRDGTGLGLAIARRLVEMMSGQIGLESGQGGLGTLVWFALPLAAELPDKGEREVGPGRAKSQP